MNIIKNFKKLLYETQIYYLYRLLNSGYLYQMGFFKSCQNKLSIDRNGNALPWITYPCLEFLKEKINKDWVVFEWGSGGSSEWWSENVSKIISVEHNKEWFDNVKEKKIANHEIYYIKLECGGYYCNKINEYRDYFDVIVVDGRDRVNCCKNLIDALKSDGIIIFDNSDRELYDEAYSYLRDNGFKEIKFTGMGPINLEAWSTSIFYRNKNNIGV